MSEWNGCELNEWRCQFASIYRLSVYSVLSYVVPTAHIGERLIYFSDKKQPKSALVCARLLLTTNYHVMCSGFGLRFNV